MSFSNRIRLPFKLHKPQFPESAERYRKANGETVTLSVTVRKVYEGLTDSIPEKLHERLKIALVHDRVEVEGDKYVGVIAQDGDYQIEWQDFLSHPLAQGKFKAEVTPFNATNSNCGTCEDMIQVVANDDTFPGTLAVDTSYNIKVLDNDKVCCYPVTISLVTYDLTYIDAIVVDPTDQSITIHVSPTSPSGTNVLICTYRAQCANGQYDEAKVYATIDGVSPACPLPTSLAAIDITETTATITFTDAAGALLYYWSLNTLPDNTPFQSASTPPGIPVNLTGLTPGQQYRFLLQTDCGGGSYSGFASVDFTTITAPPTDSCGEYELFNNDDQNFRPATYIDCTGLERNINIAPLHVRGICALQSSPGVPVEINTHPFVSVDYIGIC